MVAVPQTHPDVPPLESGMRMRRDEFHDLFSAHPEIKKAELVEGIVYVASPTSIRHAEPHGVIATWLGNYALARRSTVQFADNLTVVLSNRSEVMPDGLLRYRDGQSRLRADGYLEGPPELVVEVAASSASYDMHQKKDVYLHAGVREYVVWQVWENRLTWWRLEGESYVEVEPGPGGIVESPEFPGLRLNVPALLDGDFCDRHLPGLMASDSGRSVTRHVSIRTENPSESSAIDDVVRRAFSSTGEGDGEPEVRLVRELRRDPGFDSELSFVAEVDDRIVGHLLFTPVRIEGDGEPWKALALARLSVMPGYERLRVGTLLMRHGLEACRDAGYRIVVVLGHPKYYARFGFEPASEHGITGPYAAAGEAFRVLALQPGALREVNGTVIYPAPFLDI